jgi:D-arabinose 1-dehydrogenase-like Zn-dependent alcohol dehydrogenase
VQYALAQGAIVIGIDGGPQKGIFIKSLGATEYIDFQSTPDTVAKVHSLTKGGADAVIVTAGSNKAFAQAADMLRIGGTMSCVGIPPGRGFIETPISAIVIKGLHITGNLVGSLKECLEAVDLVRRGVVKPRIKIRPFEDLAAVYEELEKGDVEGRIVLKIAKDE